MTLKGTFPTRLREILKRVSFFLIERSGRANREPRKEGGAHAVKLEGGIKMFPQVEKLVAAGIPVMAHIGFTPQAENQLGGYRIQGKGSDAQRLIDVGLLLSVQGQLACSLRWCQAMLQAGSPKQSPLPRLESERESVVTLRY